MSSIPASAIVNVTPNVLAAGGAALDLNGLFLTDDSRVPIGSVASFASASAVNSYFGSTSRVAQLAEIYFNGFEGSNAKPGALLVAQYPGEAVAAFLRGGNISSLTLTELQAISGSLSVSIDGSPASGSPNLSAATSFSSGAKIIQTALGISGVQTAAVTGSISGTTMTITGVASGAIRIGDVAGGTGVTAQTRVTAFVSGTGGTGTYTVDTSQTAISQSITMRAPAVYYDSVSGAYVIQSGTVGEASTIDYATGTISATLKLTQATAAVTSQGADAATPDAFMDALTLNTQNWATFTTTFDPDVSGNDNKFAFAEWTSSQNNRFAYACWDTDDSATTTVPATTSLGYLIQQADLSGTCLLYDPSDGDLGAFVCGYGASLDFEQVEGRFTLAFRRQSGLTAGVTDQTSGENLISNGYNFYGAYATAADEFIWLYPGSISGEFLWMDSFINEIWLNNSFQLALMVLLQTAGSIPYNTAGYQRIIAACLDTINQALVFGAIRAGVALSSSQISQVNSSAGVRISDTLQQAGWYMQVRPASATTRAARQSPPATFWYTDGQSVQKIELESIEIQ